MPRYGPADLGPSLTDVATQVANEEGVRPELVHAVMQQESGGNPSAVSKKGAIGLMQLMPDTAAALGVDPHDPEQNLRGGVRYLKQQIDQFGDEPTALAAYNAGPSAVRAAGGIPNIPETQQYVQAIMAKAGPSRSLSAADQPPGPPATGAQPSGRFGPQDLSAAAPGTAAPLPPGAQPPAKPEQGFFRSLLSSVDPRTPEGRRNIAGGLGAAAAGALTEGAGALPTFAAITGAGLAGAGEETGEEVAHGKPLDPFSIAEAGGGQAATEATGAALMWPVKALGRRILATPVASAAKAGLADIRASLAGRLDDLLSTASDAVKSARGTRAAALETARMQAASDLEAARRSGAAGVAAARDTGRTNIRAARDLGAEIEEQARQKHAANLADLEGQYANQPAPPPPGAVGRQVGAVLQGPAQTALDQAGQAVEDAAATGPAVNWAPVKSTLQSMWEKAVPASVRAPELEGAGYLKNVIGSASPAEQASLLAAIKSSIGDQLPSDHPLPGVLGKIMQAPDEIPFQEAHQYKRMLDDAINWDRTAKTQAQGITKGIRGTIRDAMTGNPDYDAATSAYQSVIPLYRRGLAPKIKQQLIDYPQYAIESISPKQPDKLQMLKELLTTQAAKGGGDRQGQAAWDSVRSALIYKHVTSGPLESLGDRLEKFAPLRPIVGDDAAGSGVLSRLSALSDAYQHAKASGLADIDTAKNASTFLTDRAKDHAYDSIKAATQASQNATWLAKTAGRAQVATTKATEDAKLTRLLSDLGDARAAKKAAQAPTAEEVAFTKAKLGRRSGTEQLQSDMARAFLLSPRSVWQNLAVLRLLHGPRSADLVQWAAYSPARTQALVKLMTGPTVGLATADAGRLLSGFYDDTTAEDQQHLTGSDGRRLTRGVVQSTQHEAGPPQLRRSADSVLGPDHFGPSDLGPPPSSPSDQPPARPF